MFSPTVAVEDLKTEEERARASRLCSLVQEEDVSLINSQITAAFGKESRNWPSEIFSGLENAVRQNWLQVNYYDLVNNVLKKKDAMQKEKHHDDNVATVQRFGAPILSCLPPSSSKSPMPTQGNPFCSPKRRRITEVSNAEEENAVDIRSVEQLHTQSSGRSDAFVLEAYLLHAPEESRWVEVSVRRGKTAPGSSPNHGKTGEKENISVATLLLADRTGAIRFDLWRTIAREQFELCLEWFNNTDELVLLRIERFTVAAEKRSFEYPIQRMHSVESTMITRLTSSTQASVINNSITVPASLYVSDFSSFPGQRLSALTFWVL